MATNHNNSIRELFQQDTLRIRAIKQWLQEEGFAPEEVDSLLIASEHEAIEKYCSVPIAWGILPELVEATYINKKPGEKRITNLIRVWDVAHETWYAPGYREDRIEVFKDKGEGNER